VPFDEDQIGLGREMYPQRLADQGYRLGYSGKWHAGLAKTAADVGFEGFSLRDYGGFWDCDQYKQHLADRGLPYPERVTEYAENGSGSRGTIGDGSGWLDARVESHPEYMVAERSIDLLREFAQDDRPFFFTTNFWGPHSPYLPSEEYKDLYDPSSIPPWPNFEDDLAGRPRIHAKYRQVIYPNSAAASWDDWSRVVARYFAQATMIDSQIGRIVEELKRLGLYEDTVIVFTADHGETVGIHGGAFDKGAMAYEEVYHIPMIAKLPGSAQAGTTRDGWVSLIDLADTFCELAGTGMTSTDGQSLLPLLHDPSTAWREHLVSEFHGHRVPYTQRILWWQQYKYVMNAPDVDELYDLDADPAEMNNRIWDSSLSAPLADMRSRLLDHMTATADRLGPQWPKLLTQPMTEPW